MKTSSLTTLHLSISLFVILLSPFAVVAQTTTFTFHGRLPAEHNPQTGMYDFQFNLYDEASGTNAPLNTTPIVIEDVQVINRAFSVSLNFGSQFNTGADRYLEIGVRDANSTGGFIIESPRTQIFSAPYAIRSLSAATADTATNAQNLGGTSSDNFVQNTDARLTDARTPTAGSGNYIQNTSSIQTGANFNIDGMGTASVFNSTTQFRIGGLRVLSVPGEDNLFVGVNSGTSNTTGNNNSFVGYHSGHQNTTGFRNSFFGTFAGFNNTTGHNNTFVGAAAGGGNTTGNFNIFIGESTGLNNGAGNHNTIIGSLAAGQFSSAPGFFATAIGAASRVSSSDTIVLGKTAGVYDGVSRPADTVRIPGHLQVTGSITASSFNGSGLTNIDASNITTGTLNNARLDVVSINKGGTGITSAGANGNFLRSNGTSFTSSPLQVGDVPDLSASYIRNQTGAVQSGGFNLSGNGTAAMFNANTQFNIGNNRVLSVPGTGNTFAGVNAGASHATSANNSFFGEDAGRDNNSGTDNSFFGVQSGRQNTSGGNNTFIGVNTGYGNTVGHSNAFAGMQAGQSNTTGYNNSFFGYIAGTNNITGTFNSAFGSHSNVGDDNLSFATALGAGAVVNTSDTIVLGKQSGTYDAVSRPADTVQIPGNLNVAGTIAGNINGSSITNINASNITTGTLDNARLGAIATANIADGAITEPKLGASAVTTQKIADSGVTTAKIADAAVTAAKIGSNQVVKNINGLTDTVNLAAGANVTLTPSGNTLTISAAGGAASPWSTNGSTVFYNLGNVGIGTDNPDVVLRVHHSSSNANVGNMQLPDLALALRNTSNTNGNMTFISFQDASGFGNAQIGAVQTNQLTHSAELVFFTRNAAGASGERLRIKSDGIVVLNTLGTAGGNVLCRNASNQIAACSSSLRYKTNIAPFSFGLNLVQRLRPIRFEWKEGGMKDVGFGAEDVAAVEPLLVNYNHKGEVEGVKYDRVSAVLVNAVKEQQTQIEAQQAQLAAQQKQLENQQIVIEALKRLVCRQHPSVDLCR